MGESKLGLLDEMTAAYSDMTRTMLKLKEAKKNKEAAKIQAQLTKLRAEIDQVRGFIAVDWTAKANALAADVKTHNETVQEYITSIQDNVETAQNVVKLVGAVNDLIVRVKSMLPIANSSSDGEAEAVSAEEQPAKE